VNTKRILIILASVVAVIIVATVVWLFATNKVGLVFGEEEKNNSSLAPVVCDQAVVSKYNEATDYKFRNGSDTPSMDEVGIKQLAADIKSMENHQADPTCQTILFWAAYFENDLEAAKGLHSSIKELHSQRMFPDSNLRTAVPLFEYGTTIEFMTEPDAGDQEES
jgi:hypothetical protein